MISRRYLDPLEDVKHLSLPPVRYLHHNELLSKIKLTRAVTSAVWE